MSNSLRSLLDIRSYFPQGERVDRKTIGVLLVTAISMTLIYYYGQYTSFQVEKKVFAFFGLKAWGESIRFWLNGHKDASLHQMIYWAGICIFFYLVFPALVVKFIFRDKLSEYGLKFKGMFSTWKVYLVLFLVVFPFVVLVSYEDSFQQTYPFWSPAKGEPVFPRLWYWEIFYAIQFFSLEFFFRGFMIHGTRHRFGIYSVFIMVVPYCMIHFAKPFPEACGSILAGIMLGFLSYRTRSVWMGAMIHVAVAISMDYLSLWHKGFFH
jgi:membrane protease YdiL (CAAX protease family)